MRALIRPAALQRLEWHRSQGHALVLVSSGLDLYLEPLAVYLGVPDVLCTRLATRDGAVFSGAVDGEDCTGAAKVRRLPSALASSRDVKLHATATAPATANCSPPPITRISDPSAARNPAARRADRASATYNRRMDLPFQDLWLPAVRNRMVLFANHVLTGCPPAVERLRAHAGKAVRVDVSGWPGLVRCRRR